MSSRRRVAGQGEPTYVAYETFMRTEDVHSNLVLITSQLEFIEIESACHYSGTAIFDETPCTKSDNFQ